MSLNQKSTPVLLIAAVIATSIFWTSIIAENDAETKTAKKIVGPLPEINDEMNCQKCHAKEVDAWQQTKHFNSDTLTETDSAQAIMEKMGVEDMEESKDCRQCHFTSVIEDDELTPTWGVSCESCHGPAADWVKIHNKIGGKTNAKDLAYGAGKKEAKETKMARLNAAAAKGMIHTESIYDIAKNCLSCHTISNENVVNKGGHPIKDFDLVAYSQGEVRHNFVGSQTNYAASPERLRVLFVTGALAELEVALQSLAKVKEKGGAFHKGTVSRANAALKKMKAIQAAIKLPEIEAALTGLPETFTGATTVKPETVAGLAKNAKAFVAGHDGSKLKAVDACLPAKAKYVGKVFQE